MSANGAPAAPPAVLRRLESASAAALADLAATFEDLQTVLACCERLVTELARDDGGPDDVVVEAVWTTALLSYSRCFSVGAAGAPLSEDDLAVTNLKGDVRDWHKVLLQLRDHYCDPQANPRERFSVGAAQDLLGAATGVAITSARQPLVDELTVRQTGAIAFALSSLVNDRIAAAQAVVYDEIKHASKSDLDRLARLDVTSPEGGP